MQKTVLITGASSGFGLEASAEFLAAGYQVLAAVRGGVKRQDLFADLIARYPSKIELLELDLQVPESIDRLVATLKTRSPIEALVNNAGYGLFGATEDVSDYELRKQMEVNFFGTFTLTQKLLPSLRKNKGVVLTVSSIVGRHALPLSGAYCASKFAVEGWMESLSAELKPYGVACYLLEPGGYPTGFGTSLSWSEPHADSAYQTPTKGYQILRENISKQNEGKSIRPVAKKMVYLVSKRPFGLRHIIGSDAVMTALFGKIFPENIWHNVISFVMNKLQRKYV